MITEVSQKHNVIMPLPLSPPFCSAAVNSALSLVMQLEEDLRCTNTTQMEVEELQSVVAALIAQAQTDIDQVASRKIHVKISYMSVPRISGISCTCSLENLGFPALLYPLVNVNKNLK